MSSWSQEVKEGWFRVRSLWLHCYLNRCIEAVGWESAKLRAKGNENFSKVSVIEYSIVAICLHATFSLISKIQHIEQRTYYSSAF